MTHEPECLHVRCDCVACALGNLPCTCAAVRSAYQRGREDAVKALIDLPAAAWGENLSPLDFEAIFAAVRGDGEQA